MRCRAREISRRDEDCPDKSAKGKILPSPASMRHVEQDIVPDKKPKCTINEVTWAWEIRDRLKSGPWATGMIPHQHYGTADK